MSSTPGMAPTLHELQRWMAAHIVRNQPLATFSLPALTTCIAAPEGVDVAERLSVYSGGYPARIHESLGESFPAVAHVLGDGAFCALAARFAADVALHSYNLNDAGQRFAAFVNTDPLGSRLPFLADLAQLEWHVASAFHAPELPRLDPTSLARWSIDDWDQAVLHFQPAVALLSSPWPIREIWDCRETPTDEIDVDLENRPDHVLVRRSGYAVVCESLDAAQATALHALLAGHTLGSVIAAVTERGGDAAAVSAWFSHWMAGQLITACRRAVHPESDVR